MPLSQDDFEFFETKPDRSPEQPAEDRGGRYCLDCFYSLHGLERVGRCPECGRPYNLSDLYSYSVDPHKPGLRLRWRHRLIALVIALALCAYPFMPVNWFCTLMALFPVWQFAVLLSWFIALGIDRVADKAYVAIGAGSVIGMLTLLPIGWYPVLLIGGISGAFCGLQIFYLKITGWLD